MAQNEEFPVFLFTGFLEAGKTRFIQETLEDRRFNSGERTLLIMCEEGIEEYDPSRFSGKNVFTVRVENEEDLTTEFLAAAEKKYRVERAVVEYNGMWMLQHFYDVMPENWIVYQEFMFADATTFLNYNANMRQFVVDKLQSCELVVFNRFKSSYNKMDFHKIVRGVTRRSDIAYEYAGGKVEYDDIEDPLPFDINAPVIEVGDDAYALWYRDISEEPDKYIGKTIRFKGVTVSNGSMPENCFAIGRQVMTCCVQDIRYHGVIAETGAGMKRPESGAWVTLTSKISLRYHKVYKRKGIVLTAEKIEPAEKPEQEVATFY
jgi:hypothetical protein